MKKLIALALSVAFFVSCSTSDDPFVAPEFKNNYSNGIIVLNEGAFGTPNASIDFIKNDLSDVQRGIYTHDNGNLGDVAQSLGFHEDKAFVVLNNSNKIEVVNRYTFDHLATITAELSQPRYIAFAAGKAYVTNYASKKVSVYNAENFEFVKSIPLNSDLDFIVSENNKIYVQKAAFGTGNEIAVIDTKTDEVIKTLKFQDALQGLVSNTGFVYALSSINTRTNFYKISAETDAIHTEFTSTKVAAGRNLRVDQNTLYFTAANKVYSWKTTATTVDYNALFEMKGDATAFNFLYGFNVIGGKVYTADALDFGPKSAVTVYNLNGEIAKTFESGISTNGFYKN